MARPATGRGMEKYIPFAVLGIFSVLLYLHKEDKQSLKQIEQFARERAIKAGWNEEEKKAA